MIEFVAAFAAFVVAMAALALGVVNGREPLRGSCGGLGACEGCQRRCSAKENSDGRDTS